jgi:phenylalanyl-tRNA synthetase alpha chain
MEEKIEQIKKEFYDKIKDKAANELKEIEKYFLGRKGKVAELFREMKSLPKEERKAAGAKINDLKEFIENTLNAKITEQEKAEKEQKLLEEKIDVTVPGLRLQQGGLHILTKTMLEVEKIFLSMGFDIMTGPEIENEYYNFEALNIPEFHPARDMQDTFYLMNKFLLRTQTSPIQVRTMEKYKPPIRIIAIGRCYRKDPPDAHHFPIFHQVEGLVVDKDVSFANLKGTLSEFTRRMFGENVKVRFNPSYFPFVEPGAETSINFGGWLEMGGSGMVHPNVLKNVGIDPEEYQGFAFGWGIERIAMVKYNIPDIRFFYRNDLRFLNQFK